MSTIELKENIIEQLALIDDISFLKAINAIVESKVNQEVYILSDEQKERINSARIQFNNQTTTSNFVVEEQVNEWLNSK
jgi:hypothetical protein